MGHPAEIEKENARKEGRRGNLSKMGVLHRSSATSKRPKRHRSGQEYCRIAPDQDET